MISEQTLLEKENMILQMPWPFTEIAVCIGGPSAVVCSFLCLCICLLVHPFYAPFIHSLSHSVSHACILHLFVCSFNKYMLSSSFRPTQIRTLCGSQKGSFYTGSTMHVAQHDSNSMR